MQWVQDPSQSNVDDVDYIRRAASRHFTKRRNIWKLKWRKMKITVT